MTATDSATTGASARETRRNIETAYLLSPMQQGMLFHSLYAPDSGVYFEQLAATLVGDLNVDAFRRAWQQVVDRHPILRTAFAWKRQEKPVQAVYKELSLPVEVLDWRDVPPTEQERLLGERLAVERARGFDLSKVPLLRLLLIRTGERQHRLVWSHHHILMDGWSMPILLKEVFTFYEANAQGRAVQLPMTRPYRDYIAWLQNQSMDAAEAYWRQALAGFTSPTQINVARADAAPLTGTAELERRLTPEETQRVNALARGAGVTISTVLQAAWALLLSRYSGEEDVVFGVTVSGRPDSLPGAASMVGLFINTLPMRADARPDAAVADWLRQLQAKAAEMRQYEYSPLVSVQAWSEVPREKPLFETIMVFENYPVDAALREQLGSLEIRDVRSFEQTNFPITLVSGPGRELGLKVSYDRARFDERAIDAMLGHLAALLLDMAGRPAAALADLNMLTEEERGRIVVEWNATDRDFGDATTLSEAFEAQVRATPDAPALIAEGQSLTYAELNRRATALAARLRDLGVGPERLVGLHLERSPEMIIALLAVLKAGGAYLPLDPDYPAERLEFMLADSGASVLLTQSHLQGKIAATAPRVLAVDALQLDGPDGDLPQSAKPDNLAYVIYTSGSTGAPKGVMVEHRNVLNHARALIAETGIGPGDRILQFVSLSFDAAGEEFYPALLSGAALVLPGQTQALIGPELPLFCEQHSVTIMHMPAAVWHTVIDDLLAREVGCAAPLRLLMLGGDAPDPARLRAFGKMLGRDIPFLNLYGPTEATITSTLYRTTTAAPETRLPIGKPVANARIYVLDKTGHPAPVGVAGEIHIGGAGVARGYLNRLDLTEERFIARYEERLYRTGDLGRWLPDGNLEFLGRADNQVKIRGFRVEPGEIEAALKREPGVREAVVLPWEAAADGKRLVAYLVPANGAQLDAALLRASLRGRLPDHMIPAAFVSLPALPLTSSGKLDRAALRNVTAAELEDLALGAAAYVAPRTADEELLAGIFGQILGASRVGAADSFFDLGGHSLLATRLASRIRDVFGVELPLADLFESPTVAGIAAKVAAARADAGTEPAPPITPAPRPANLVDGLPLSFAQQRLWFLDQLEPGNLFYNIPTVLRLRGQLDIPALIAALNEIVARHEVLRTTFAAKGGVPRQIIAPSLTLDIPVTDLSAEPLDQRETRALELARAEIRTPFDLAAGPLLRARLIRLADDERIAVLTIHHIVTDGWSMGVLVAELAKLYEARRKGDAASPLQPLSIQYADYAAWQRAWLEGDSNSASPLQSQLEYWKQQLAGVPARLDLPTDRPRPAVQSSNGRTHTFRFTRELSQGLTRLSQQQGVTMFMTLLAGYQTLLSRYSGQSDIVVGSALANRQRAEVEPLIGFFVNTLVFRTRFDGNPSFKELLARVRETALGAYAHQDVPFEMLVDAVQPERNLSHSPLFQAALSLQNVPVPVRELPGLTLEPVDLDKGIAGYDMLLQITETPDGLACAWEYNADLFDASTIERMAGHLQTLFAAAVADPAQPVVTLPLLTEAERDCMLVEWNNTATSWNLERTFHGLFETHAARIPDAPAAIFALPGAAATGSLTYADLDQRANQVAHHLLALGVRKGALVGISTERSLDMVTGILGILKTGAAYVPLDPTYPPDRLSFMLSDSGVVALLTQAHLLDRLPLADFSAPIIKLDADWPQIAQQPATPPTADVTADDLAYCIYTSGSTGRPKGVLLRHRGMINLAEVHHREFDMREGKRVLQFSPFSFDASVWETVMALGNGAVLVLTRQDVLASGPDLLRLMQEQRVTTVTLPPSLLTVLTPSALPDLETVIAAGERCVNEIVQAWAPGRKFFNAYGPTETTVCASMRRCDEHEEWSFGGPPIGKPLANFHLYVVDEHLQPQPIGVPGELLAGGPSLAQGYLNRPELTAERFIRAQDLTGLDRHAVAHPSGLGPRLYRTGDLVRYLPDGEIEFIGRIDDQVKVRGFRIELGEIESVLREHPDVKDAVVAARDNTLIGYYIPTEGDRAELRGELRAHLRQRLPEYMVPSALVAMDAFPLTPAGKIDRKSLPAADALRREAAAEYVAPRNDTEARLAAMAGELLKVERVGVEDNFFELGGHSLLATQLISRIRDELKVEVPLKALFEHPTVAGLAAVVDEALKKQAAEQAKVTDALAMVKGMTPEQVKALLAAKKARSAAPEQGGKATGA